MEEDEGDDSAFLGLLYKGMRPDDDDEPPTEEGTAECEVIPRDVEERAGTTKEDSLEYWQKKTLQFKPTVEAMMLDHNARRKKLDEREKKEVLAFLCEGKNTNLGGGKQTRGKRPQIRADNETCLQPPVVEKVTGKDVVDLGAGIGRYTHWFLEQNARSVTALDFVPEFIEENKRAVAERWGEDGLNKTRFLCMDATKLDTEVADDSLDLVFSNWLLMYFSDDDLRRFALRAHRWLRAEGFLFFRESCLVTVSGCKPSETAPGHYREPEFYAHVFEESFELVRMDNLKTFVKCYNNPYQYCYLFRKR